MAMVRGVYFMHLERGLRIAVINLILNSASSVASIICGQVYASLSSFLLCQIQIVPVFLSCPETTYLEVTP
jgi:hypothetical protein